MPKVKRLSYIYCHMLLISGNQCFYSSFEPDCYIFARHSVIMEMLDITNLFWSHIKK